ncbi:aminopeptidase [bacterium]|nr:MAG: aminopeptidase [bacterium]
MMIVRKGRERKDMPSLEGVWGGELDLGEVWKGKKERYTVGLGKETKPHHVREAFAKGVEYLGKKGIKKVLCEIPDIPGVSFESAAGLVAEGAVYGGYGYPDDVMREIVIPIKGMGIPIEENVEKARMINLARRMVDAPANELTAQRFVELVKENVPENVKVTVYGRKELEKKGFGGILAVAQGSDREPLYLVLERKGRGLIGLVGKGVIFDSGGISLKDSKGMHVMKGDMAGAAVVFAVFSMLVKFTDRGVMAFIPLVENLPSGKALKPGDVVKMYSGKRVEIISTDAEGRLILADALWHAEEHNPDVLIDVATLTGGCNLALGPDIAAVMGYNDRLIEGLIETGRKEGENFWRLPLYEGYFKPFESKVADFKNSGGREASTIKAGLFLSRFIRRKKKWLHIDIAGKEFRDERATGFGIRTLYSFLK